MDVCLKEEFKKTARRPNGCEVMASRKGGGGILLKQKAAEEEK